MPYGVRTFLESHLPRLRSLRLTWYGLEVAAARSALGALHGKHLSLPIVRDTAQTMSEENVEIVYRLLNAWNRQDIDGILALTDPEAEYVNAPQAVEPGTRRGHAELVTVFRKQWEALSGAVQEIDRLHHRGDEIITEGRVSRTMPGSDTRISNPLLMSWKFREGKVIRLRQLGAGPEFPDALKAAGLRE